MRFIKPIAIIIFFIGTAIFVYKWANFKMSLDTNPPIIEIGPKKIKVSVDADDKELRKSVIVHDEKDGDLTGSLIIESISKFTDVKNHICNITYAVEDSDKNVAKKTRQLEYTDYTPPKFYLRKPLCIETSSDANIRELIGAKDCLDGDISRKVKVLSSEFSTSSSGDNTVVAQVTNSLGDTITMKAHVVINSINVKSPTINLKDNLVYVKKGDSFNERDYIKSVVSPQKTKLPKSRVKVSKSTVNTKKKGCYYVEYIINKGRLSEAVTNLTVVVED
ncbi:MAG: hypothetical protein K6E58_01130 [Eubacterium sp.]|nr:hypothetical protein [Eubacterium sp.]